MKALIWIAAILAALICLPLLVRLRVTGVYGEAGPSLRAALGAVPMLTVPRAPGAKKAKREKKPKQAKKPKKKKEETEEKDKGGSVPGFRSLLPIISKALGKLKRRLSIDELTLWYLSAGDDPASTALMFGGASASAEVLVRALESLFRVKQRDIRTSVSFTEPKPRVYVRLRLSVSLGVLIWIAAGAALAYSKARRDAGKK